MKWAIEFAPPMPAQLVATLTGLAFHADKHGRGAYPSVARLAALTCKAERSVRRDLRQLEEAKLIRPGDQTKAAHLPADKRPLVYDLAVERTVPDGRAGHDEGTRTSARTLASSRERGRAAREAKKARPRRESSPKRGDVDVRADADVRADVDVPSGGTPTSAAGGRGRPPKQQPEPTTETTNTPTPPAPSALPTPQPDGFDAFWAAYPRKASKGHARKAYTTAITNGVDPAHLLAAAQRHRDYHAACRTEQRFIPHPATWLNGERYDDELPNPQALAPTGTDGHGYRPYRDDADEADYYGDI